MKKHKSVVAILLSVMIVFTFMPTLAFAQTVDDDHNWDTKGTVTKKASTCYDYTLREYKCLGEDVNQDYYYEGEDKIYYGGDHLDCGATYTTIEWDGHNWGTKKVNTANVTVDEFLAQVAVQDPSQWKTWADKFAEDEVCYVIVPVCKDCGEYDLDGETGVEIEYFNHQETKASAAKPCSKTYECKFCHGVFVRENPADHVFAPESEWQLVGTHCSAVDLQNNPNAGGISVYKKTCTVCGEDVLSPDVNHGNVEHHGIGEPVTPTPAQADRWYYVRVGNAYYEPNEVVTAPTCTRPGTGRLVCADCGTELGTCFIKATGHTMTTVSVDATCTADGFTAKRCTVCNYTNDYVTDKTKLGHDYKVTVLAEPSCAADGITIAECARCHKFENRGFAIISDDDNDLVTNASGKLYFTGFNNELKGDKRIEVADYTIKDHDFGKYEDMTEPTCISGTIQARKCAVDGLFDVHHYKEVGQPKGHQFESYTQEPTCGSAGFTYTQCSVCGEYGESKTFGKPVVAHGAKCKFEEWVVETPATPFAKGTEKLVCSVCKDDGHVFLEGGVIKEGNVTRNSIPKTTIAAPKVKAGKKKATVTVKAVEGAVKYQIKVNGKVKKTVTSAKKVTIKKLKGGKKAKFQIVAFNAEGVKAASKVKSVKIKK